MVDPRFEFAYDRMMTKGGKTYHWVIRQKGAQVKEKPKEEAPSKDPAKILAPRFAKSAGAEGEGGVKDRLPHRGLLRDVQRGVRQARILRPEPVMNACVADLLVQLPYGYLLRMSGTL